MGYPNGFYFHDLIKNSGKLNYFEVISLLFYFKDHQEYNEIKREVIESSIEKFASFDLIQNDSELVHMLLDLTSCPYLSQENREKLLSIIYDGVNKPKPTEQKLSSYLASINGVYWFVNWKSLNIKQLIERNELKSQY